MCEGECPCTRKIKRPCIYAFIYDFYVISLFFLFFFLEMLTFHVTVNVLVKWKNYVDVPENGNQYVEPMGRRTVTSVWQNVSMYTG
jgi:hypothetical protein